LDVDEGRTWKECPDCKGTCYLFKGTREEFLEIRSRILSQYPNAGPVSFNPVIHEAVEKGVMTRELKEQHVTVEKKPKDDGVRWLKFKYDITIKAGMVVPAGTVVLGRPGPSPSLWAILWDGRGVGWRVEFDDGYSTIVPLEVVEAIKPLGLPVKKIPKREETSGRLETACWITLKTAIEFSPGLGYGAGTRGLGFPVSEGWIIDLVGDQHSLLIPDSAVEVEEPFRKLDDLQWLECKVNVPLRHGKFIPAGKFIVGSRVDTGWKVGAEYSEFIEDTWRTRERTGDDNSNIVKVDVTPSMIIPDSMVKAGTRARWFNSSRAVNATPPEIRVTCAKWPDELPMSRVLKLVYTGWRLKPKVDIVAENGKRYRKGESITGMPVSEGWEVLADSEWKLWAIIPRDLVETTNSVYSEKEAKSRDKERQ
jgi:hypothetical protein